MIDFLRTEMAERTGNGGQKSWPVGWRNWSQIPSNWGGRLPSGRYNENLKAATRSILMGHGVRVIEEHFPKAFKNKLAVM